MSDTRTRIIDTAEAMMRQGGYHAFSFRQIADHLEVKSASIHYHFPSKENLGLAVVERYTDNFLNSLGSPTASKSPIDIYVSAFESALKENFDPCLCGILAGETGRLPELLSQAIAQFTQRNLTWLESALEHQRPDLTKAQRKDQALLIFSALEGAISFAALTKQKKHLTTVGKSLKALVKS